jgi:hypothetical protein
VDIGAAACGKRIVDRDRLVGFPARALAPLSARDQRSADRGGGGERRKPAAVHLFLHCCVGAPRAGAGGGDIEQDEAVEDDELAFVENRVETLRCMDQKVAYSMMPA